VQETLLSLYRLQQIDLKALELERAAQQIPDKINELESEPDPIRSELGEMNTELETLRTEQADAETAIGEKTADTAKWKRRLNEIRTPREYQALSREVEQAERVVKSLEERVMELMATIEDNEKLIENKSAALKQTEMDIAKKVIGLKSEQVKLSTEARAASQGRDEIISGLSANIVKLYDRIRGRRAGVAVAQLDNSGTCGGCQIQLRPQQTLEVRKLESVVQCPQCLRILVLNSLVTALAEQATAEA